jgi:beta-galactosidase
MHPRYRNWQTDSPPHDLAMITDVQAYNYRYMYFPGDGRRFPWMKFYQSEASISAMGPNFFEMNQDKVIGLAYWGQIDYLGESQGWPAKGWAQGAFDLSLQPKPIAYLLRSMFSDEPVVHIGVIDDDKSDVVWNDVQVGTARMSENWNRKPDTKATINVYTNCDKVVLKLNGKVVAEKENTLNTKGRNKLRIDDIMYQPGTLEAIGYKDGKPVASHKIMTAGKIQRLNLEADNNNWLADGKDLQHIRVTAVDKKGNKVWSANQQLTFEVVGDAKIVGVDNGDITSEELTVGNTRRLFNGSALVILRAGKNAGKVQLKVSSPDLKTQIIKLTTN